MPSRKVAAKEALKKTRKNFKKTFSADSESEDYKFLNNVLCSNKLRDTINLYDALRSCPLTENINAQNCDIFRAIREVLDDLVSVSETNDEALELTDILTSSHMKGYVEAVTNITVREFVPQINVASVAKATSLHSLKSDHHSINRSVTDINGFLPDLTSEPPYQSHHSLNYDSNPEDEIKDLDELSSTLNGGITLVGIPKEKDEKLGMTVGIRNIDIDGNGNKPVIIVERIMTGSKIEQRKLLAPGDIVTEVNGTNVDSPELFQNLMRNAEGIVTLKVLPVPRKKKINSQFYVRTFFAYDPNYDTLIPCKEAGLSFLPGEILHVLNQEDQFWWQARHVNNKERGGLIPTEYLEERRRAYLQNAKDPNEVKYKMFGFGIHRKKKVKVDYSVNNAAEYDRSDIIMYEEVTRVPGFKRPVLCLLGALGVGRSTIRDEILRRFPEKYGYPIKDTSRPPRPNEGHKYNFISPELMQTEHLMNNYVDFGEYNENFYGIHIKTVREIIKTGRTCLLDCSAEGVKKLRTSEFMPWVLFLAAPSIDCMRAMYEYGMQSGFTEKYKNDEDFNEAVEQSMELEREYRHLFDEVIVVDNMTESFNKILEYLNRLEKNQQWVPSKWIY